MNAHGTAPSPRRYHCACLFNDGRTDSMFIFGGKFGLTTLNDIHKYSFGKWH